MDLLRLHLVNFANYQNTEIDLQDLHVVGLIGQNGSGKSSFIESITWALYGISTKGSKKEADNYVRTGANECTVTLEFFLNNHYRIIRSWNKEQRRGSINLFVMQENQWEPRGKNGPETQHEIEKILRMDYTTFTASAFSLQEQIGVFTSCTDQERKQILSRIIGLATWETINKSASEKVRELAKVELKTITDTLTLLDREVLEEDQLRESMRIDVAHYKKIDDFLESKRKELDDLKTELQQYRFAAEEKETLERQLRIAREEFDRESLKHQRNIDRRTQDINENYLAIKAQQGEIDCWQEVLNNRERYEEAIQQIRDYQKMLEPYPRLKEELREVEFRLHQFDKVIDVPCSCDLQKQCPFLKDMGQDEMTELSLHHTELICLKGTYEQIERLLSELQNERAWEYELLTADTAIARCQEKIDNYQKYNDLFSKEIKEWTTSFDEIKESYAERTRWLPERLSEIYEQLGTNYDEKLNDYTALQGEVADLEQELKDLAINVGASTERLEVIKKKKQQRDKLKERYDALNKELNLHKIIERASGKKKGVPTLVVENAIPEIENFANELLSRVTYGRFSIILETQIESKTVDSVQEVLKIFVVDRGVIRAYQTYSGAEKFILNLSIRVAICKFLAHRSGTQIKILVIDEGFGSLDDENMPRVVEAITEIAKDFNKIFIVTHIKGMKDLLPQKIYFQDAADGTKIHIVR